MNKKGQLGGILNNIQMVLLIALVLGFIVGAVFILGTVGPIVSGEGKNIATQIRTAVNQNNPNTNLSAATTTTTTIVENVLGTGELLVYMFFMGLFIGYLILAYNVRTYPYLAFFWVFLMVVMVVLSVIVSNAYQQAAANGPTASFYTAWGTNNFLMENLPFIVAVIGIIGGILLFVIVQRVPEEELSSGVAI